MNFKRHPLGHAETVPNHKRRKRPKIGGDIHWKPLLLSGHQGTPRSPHFCTHHVRLSKQGCSWYRTKEEQLSKVLQKLTVLQVCWNRGVRHHTESLDFKQRKDRRSRLRFPPFDAQKSDETSSYLVVRM